MLTTAIVHAAAAQRCRYHPARLRAARAHPPAPPRGRPMSRIAGHPDVREQLATAAERGRLPRQRRAHEPRARAAASATATSRRPRAGTPPTWSAATTSRTRAPAATTSATACARPATASPGDGWRVGREPRLGHGRARDARTRSSTRGSRARRTRRSCSRAATASSASASPAARRSRRRRPPGATYTMNLGVRSAHGQDERMTASAPSGARYGVTSMVAPLQRVLVRSPRPAATGTARAGGRRTRPRWSASTRRSSSCSTASARRSRSPTRSTARSTRSTCTTR